MTRTGKFGRQPRQATSLTSTLVAIAREYQNQRAQNIMDAWMKGGTFEGQKATDEFVLKFWKDKAAGVSKDDPLYDTYHNAQTQLDYTIHESKMTAGYAMKKYTDQQMVSFYLGWAKKVPKNSEFYRVLQRDAGQYMRNSRASSEAEARRRKEERYQRQQAGTQKQMEASGEYAIDTLRRIAQSGYVRGGIAPTIGAPGSGSDLTDFDPSDPDVMLRLIAAITTQKNAGATGQKRVGPEGVTVDEKGDFRGNPDVIYYDDDKNPVTGTDIMRKFGKLDIDFVPGAVFDVAYVTGLLDRQMQGLNERIDRAKKTGHMSDVASLTKSKEYVAVLNREIAAYPVQRAYQEAHDDFYAVVDDRSSSLKAIDKAWTKYSATLTALSKDPRIEADDNLRSRLIAERDGTPGVPTLNESFTGLASGQFNPESSREAFENKVALDRVRDEIDIVAAGGAMWAYGERDDNGVFVPQAGGSQIGAALPSDIQAGGLNMQVITVDDPLGGGPMQVAVTAVPVFATAKDPRTGESLDRTNGNPIAWAFDIPNGGGTFSTKYGFMTKDGLQFTDKATPPWDPSLTPVGSSTGGNHLEIDLTDEVARSLGYTDKDPVTGLYAVAPDEFIEDEDLPNGISIRDAGVLDREGALKPATIVFSPQDLAWSTDTRIGLGTPDPISDFKSLTLSNLMSTEDGRSILMNLDRYPAFKGQLEGDAYRYAGYQQDLKTGAWVPGESADPVKLDTALGQLSIASTAKDFSDFVAESAKTWQRFITGSPFKSEVKGGGIGPDFTPEGFTKLATDLVKGTPFEALGNMFQPSTSTIKPPKVNEQTGFTIKPVTTIKTPALPPMGPKQVSGPTATPTSTQSYAPQTGSQAPTQAGSTPPAQRKLL